MIVRLLNLVEVQDFARAEAGSCIPATRVRVHVMIEQGLLGVVLPMPPVLLQIQAQVARSHLPGPVADVARLSQVSHYRIDDRHASRAFLPTPDYVLVSAPLALHATGVAILIKDVVTVLERPVVPEVAPEQFGNEMRRVLIGFVLCLPLSDLKVDEAWGDAAVRHPG